MKKILLSLLLLVSFLGNSQILDPVKWKTKVVQKSDTEFELIMDATIDEEWHMYSQFTPDGGALPSIFEYKNAKGNYTLVGKTKESPYKKVFNDIFEIDEYYFAKTAQFKQLIKVTNPKLKEVKVYVEYQACKEQCIQQDKTFTFKLPEIKIAEKVEEVLKDESKEESVPTEAVLNDIDSTLAVAEKVVLEKDNTVKPVISEQPKEEEKKGLWTIFFLAFFGGFAALLTPCVFPMIPMTVSFFTKQSKTKAEGKRNAILYGVSIILIYVILGSLVTAIFGADALNALSTNVWFNVIFFCLLVFFATSFLGAFEIVLPNSWANKVDRQADRGGFIGILFMALALAIVSFSCTGPIVGTLLVEAASKGGLAPIVGMVGFSLALALPFMLFAMFPGWMNSLPKSGGWLNTVKVSLGFLELALAFKFLSNADLVSNWGILKWEIFVGIWIVLFVLLTLYLFGLYRFPHDGPKKKLAKARIGVGIVSGIFTVYLILGFFKVNNLKFLSGFPPPEFYSIYEQESDCPLGLDCYKDFDEGMAYAKEENKPVLLDFTGWACVNCRKMEQNVWSEPEIYNLLKDNYVLISLYVDDRKELPEAQQFSFKYDSGRVKKISTVGQKWGTFQTINFNAASQPYYVLMSPDLEILNSSIQYTDIATYEQWLKTGIQNFKVEANIGTLE